MTLAEHLIALSEATKRAEPVEVVCDGCGVARTVTRRHVAAARRKLCRACCVHAQPGFHGKKSTLTYHSWNGMKMRCSNPKAANFHLYGQRNITFCERWSQFSNFLADMGERPVGTSIDRIDNNRGYSCGKCDDCISRGEPANCRWATAHEQAQNTSRTKLNADVVNEIRGRAEHGESAASIAKRMNMRRNYIDDIIARRCWSNIP